MNTKEKGKQNERLILDTLTLVRFLTTKLVAKLCYTSSSGLRLARRKMTDMERKKMVKRYPTFDGYIYHIGPRSDKVDHWLGLADTYIWLKQKYNITHFQPEVRFTMLQADAYCKDLNLFIEVDRATNPLDRERKVEKYCLLFESDEWTENYSRPIKEGEEAEFPHIQIITCRVEELKKYVVKHNRLGLKFYVKEG